MIILAIFSVLKAEQFGHRNCFVFFQNAQKNKSSCAVKVDDREKQSASTTKFNEISDGKHVNFLQGSYRKISLILFVQHVRKIQQQYFGL